MLHKRHNVNYGFLQESQVYNAFIVSIPRTRNGFLGKRKASPSHTYSYSPTPLIRERPITQFIFFTPLALILYVLSLPSSLPKLCHIPGSTTYTPPSTVFKFPFPDRWSYMSPCKPPLPPPPQKKKQTLSHFWVRPWCCIEL